MLYEIKYGFSLIPLNNQIPYVREKLFTAGLLLSAAKISQENIFA